MGHGTQMSYEDFLVLKQKLESVLEKAIYDVLKDMGEDVRLVEWFSSRASAKDAYLNAA